MARATKLYPDRALARVRYTLIDLLAVSGVLFCLALGAAIYETVLQLQVIGNNAILIGQQGSVALQQVQSHVNDLPFVGSSLRGAFDPVQTLPGIATDAGQQELTTVSHLALLLAAAVAGVPLLLLLLRYLPWRLRAIRRFSALNRVLRAPGARDAATLQVLAARALYTLPFTELARVSPDPIGEWRAGHYQNLARAVLASEGFDVRRYRSPNE